MNDPKNSHRSIAGIFALAMIVLGCTFLEFEDTDATEVNADEYPLIDLDGDGTTDFALKLPPARGHENAAGQKAKVVPKRSNEIIQKKNGFVASFDRGELIGVTLPDTLEWVSEAPYLFQVTYFSYPDSNFVKWRGPWPSERDQYLGLKLIRGEEAYYGWAHVHVDTSSENVTVRDRGYNTDPGQPIRAGSGE
jgi:hypothetical protein